MAIILKLLQFNYKVHCERLEQKLLQEAVDLIDQKNPKISPKLGNQDFDKQEDKYVNIYNQEPKFVRLEVLLASKYSHA